MPLRPILCVVGPSGTGKTTLLEQLVRELARGGLKVGAVKHAAHGPQINAAGKDSSRLAAAGAAPSIVAGPEGVTVQNPEGETPLLDLAEIHCRGCDLVLAEGYKHSPHDKVFLGPPEAAGGARGARLVVSEQPAGGALHRDDTAGIAAWVRQWLQRRRRLGEGVVGAVMVGGQSRRMGSDKASLRFRGRLVLADLTELLGGRLEEVWLIGRAGPPRPRAEEAAAFGQELSRCLRWQLDLRFGCGPLGGIATALRLAAGRAVLAVACDMPALAGEAVDLLLSERRADRPGSVFRNPATGKLEPLAAIYEPGALAGIERALAGEKLSAGETLRSLGAHVVEAPAALAGQLASVNTPEDLQALEAGA